MSKDTKKLIPQLRFPEFLNEGEWEEIFLGKLGELINGLTYRSEIKLDKKFVNDPCLEFST